MQILQKENVQHRTLNDSAVSIPKFKYTTNILNKNIEVDKNFAIKNFEGIILTDMWNYQHPLIHTWLLLSSVSICVLSALLFIIH